MELGSCMVILKSIECIIDKILGSCLVIQCENWRTEIWYGDEFIIMLLTFQDVQNISN